MEASAVLNIVGFDITNVSATALVAVCVISILRGWLVPAKVMQERIKDKDQVIADWRGAAEAKDATIAALSSQLNEALEVARLTSDVMEALRKVADIRE